MLWMPPFELTVAVAVAWTQVPGAGVQHCLRRPILGKKVDLDGLVEGGMRIIACGLDQDFRGLPFGAMPELLCRAELVDKLQAVCHSCGGPATMTQRLVDGAPAPADGETIVVGALDSYEARCRSCHELRPGVLSASGL